MGQMENIWAVILSDIAAASIAVVIAVWHYNIIKKNFAHN